MIGITQLLVEVRIVEVYNTKIQDNMMMEYMNLDLVDKEDVKFKIELPRYGTEDGYILLKRQFSYKDGDKTYFVKIDQTRYSGECYNELSAFHIARLFGLDCVEYEVLPIIVNGELTRASRCRSYLNEYEHNISLYELMYDLDIKASRLTRETLYSLCVHLADKTGLDKNDIYTYFIEIALFDYLTTNDDRHLKNISFIKGLDYYRFAPIYDNGHSFFSENIIERNRHIELTDDLIEDRIRHKNLSSQSIFKNIDIFDKVDVRSIAECWLKRTNNLKDLYQLEDIVIDKNHLRLVEYRFKEILKE